MKNKRFTIALLLLAVFALSCIGIGAFSVNTTANAATQTVDIYAINDFHGAVDKMPQIAGYLAARKAEGAVIINSGDMFQGSMESNSNYGKLLSDCMDLVGFDAFTFGNHEFDWGLDNLRNLATNSNVPFLGANIYNWNPKTRTWGDFADDLAQKYTIVETNGLKVGVIGVIGEDQITSISSQLVQSIGFKSPLPIIKELATELRNEQHCDVVVASVHAGPQDIVGENENYRQPSSSAGLSEYVDAVFCAHTHAEQRYLVDGIPFVQGKSYGSYVSHVRLTISNGNVSTGTYENISYNSLSNKVDSSVKSTVQTMIDNSNDAIREEANQVLATIDVNLNSATAVPRLVCNAIADYALSQGYDIALAMVNNARNSLSRGDVTYTSLYEAIPFDNTVYIAKVSGKDILNEAKYDSNSIWRVSGMPIQDDDTLYTIAVIDYLLYHQNNRRNYNYFPSAFTSDFEPIALEKPGVVAYNYRFITRDFLLSQDSINTDMYTKDNIRTDKSQLTRSVDLPLTNITPTPGLPVLAIVLIAVGAAVIVVAAVVVVVVVVAKRKRNQQ